MLVAKKKSSLVQTFIINPASSYLITYLQRALSTPLTTYIPNSKILEIIEKLQETFRAYPNPLILPKLPKIISLVQFLKAKQPKSPIMDPIEYYETMYLRSAISNLDLSSIQECTSVTIPLISNIKARTPKQKGSLEKSYRLISDLFEYGQSISYIDFAIIEIIAKEIEKSPR